MTNDEVKRERIAKLMGGIRQICVDTVRCDTCPLHSKEGMCFFNIGKTPGRWHKAIEIIKSGRGEFA